MATATIPRSWVRSRRLATRESSGRTRVAPTSRGQSLSANGVRSTPSSLTRADSSQLLQLSASAMKTAAPSMTEPDTHRRIPTWAYAAVAAAIMGVAAVILLAMGRVPFYRNGPIRLWTSDAWGPENSQQLADPYTFTHIAHGVLLYLLLFLVARRRSLGPRFVLAVALESGWEILENTNLVIDRYRAATMALGYYGDSVLNSMGDIAACALGFLLAARLPTRVTVALVITLEVVLTLVIRDSLLLNIVMLVHPIDAVRTWQLGH